MTELFERLSSVSQAVTKVYSPPEISEATEPLSTTPESPDAFTLQPENTPPRKLRPLRRAALVNPVTGREEMVSPVWPHPRIVRSPERIPAEARARMRSVVAGEAPWPLLLCGSAGSGKTCAALCIADAYGHGAYATAPDLHLATHDQEFRRSMFGPESLGGLWIFWKNANLIILDELGTRNPSDGLYETIARAVDFRARENLPAIYVSNLAPTELERLYDDRVASRLNGGTIVYFEGDRRSAEPTPAQPAPLTTVEREHAEYLKRREEEARTKTEWDQVARTLQTMTDREVSETRAAILADPKTDQRLAMMWRTADPKGRRYVDLTLGAEVARRFKARYPGGIG